MGLRHGCSCLRALRRLRARLRRLETADGAGSVIRASLRKAGLCNFSQEMLGAGYKEMTFPREAAQAGGMEAHGLHIWPRGEHMLMGLANLDGSFTGTFYMDNEGDESFGSLESGGVEACAAFLRAHYADALPLLGGAEAAAAQLHANHLGILGTVRARQWAVGGKAVLVGDAARLSPPSLLRP